MKYYAIENRKLALCEGNLPKVSAGEVLIKTAAIGINRADIFQLNSSYKAPVGESEIPGLELAGEVVGIGAEVKDFKVGDAVCALVSGGAYAQYVTAPAVAVLPIPKGLNFNEAAALPEALFTSFYAIFCKAAAKTNETILIHGGSSGIGYSAIQLAKIMGLKVITTVGNKEKISFVKAIGADITINYKTEDFEGICKQEGGVDIVLDMVGASYLQRNIDVLKPAGRLVMLAFLEGSKTDVNLAPLLLKDLSIYSFRMRAASLAQKKFIRGELLEKIWPEIISKKFQVKIDSIFSFDEAENALTKMQGGGHMGKIILSLK